ncbi:hypothetical protein DYB37_004880 [Aphanomyces astaci]|uniref:TRP C-terminal domain-containing protein n=2 Tax=Aphanomyces astaci TaxID=112090 RepID=A0A418FGA6_APHAT|nr:hypothetical protein DYB37_004880 [Aphanomyces astaci]
MHFIPPRGEMVRVQYDVSQNTGDQGTASQPVSVAGAETPNTQTNRYIFSAVVGVTLVFLVFFHAIAIDPSYVPLDATLLGAFTAPNSWELPTFVLFMQGVALGSFANVNAPHAVLVAFTDSLAWLQFQVRHEAASGGTRRLEAVATDDGDAAVYDTFGIQQFALRSSIREKDLFLHAWTFFLIGLAVLMACAIACTAVARVLHDREVNGTTWFHRSLSNHNRRHHRRQRTHMSSSLTSSQPPHVTANHMARYVLAFTVLWGIVSILPLSMLSAYECMQDVHSTSGFGSFTGLVSLAALIAVVSAVVGTAIAVTSMSEVDLTKFNTKAMFGVLYVNLHYDHRLFGAVSLVVQLASGAVVALAPTASSQPLWLVGVHAIYMGLLVAVRPFVTSLQLMTTVLLELCLLAVFAMVAVMASPATSLQTKRTVAFGVVGVVCCVILICFVRNLVKLWVYIAGKVPFDADDQGDHDVTSRRRKRRTTRQLQLVVRSGCDLGPDTGGLPASPINTIQLVKASNNPLAIV